MIRYALGITLVVFLFGSCSSSKETADQAKNTNGGTQRISVGDQNLNQADQLAPGHAQVRMSVERVETGSGNDPVWIIEVKEVLGYGSSTPPIAVGKELTVNTATYFSNQDDDPNQLSRRSELTCTIQHNRTPGSANSSAWSLVNVIE